MSVLCAVFIIQAGIVSAQTLGSPAATNVSFKAADNTTLKAYLALPSGKGPFPAVLMIHEWWGLTHNIRLLADALAAQGYVVLAADGFRGSVAQTPDQALKLVQGTPATQVAADLDAALSYLRSRSEVDRTRVVSLGFCFGGTQSMYMGTRVVGLSAVIIFYGSGPITEASRLGTMTGPVLGIYGEKDSNIPIDQVKAFERALSVKGVKYTVTVYPGMGHAFVTADNYNKPGEPGNAWKQMLDFLKNTIAKTPGAK